MCNCLWWVASSETRLSVIIQWERRVTGLVQLLLATQWTAPGIWQSTCTLHPSRSHNTASGSSTSGSSTGWCCMEWAVVWHDSYCSSDWKQQLMNSSHGDQCIYLCYRPLTHNVRPQKGSCCQTRGSALLGRPTVQLVHNRVPCTTWPIFSYGTFTLVMIEL